MIQQMFPVIDPVTLKIIGSKPRHLVHTEGDWHWGVQADLIRFNQRGKPEMLVQERSGLVDISSRKLDQSVATQMLVEDAGNRVKTLERGLREELGISLRQDIFRVIEIGKPGSFRISKTYADNPDIYNREITSLFLIFTEKENVIPRSPRVEHVHWIALDELYNLIFIKPRRFTKTARFYFINRELHQRTKCIIEQVKKDQTIHPELAFHSSFYSYEDSDIIVNKFQDGFANLSVYDTRYSVKLVKELKRVQPFGQALSNNTARSLTMRDELRYYSKMASL